MDGEARRQLESIFNAMAGGQEFCTPEDIAGGAVQDVSQRLKNIVDSETVRNVCGDGRMSQEAFLELFCQDDYRAHEHSKSAMLQDGSKLVQQEHPAVGFSGWMFENPSEEEVSQRHLIKAIEAEVLRWRAQERSRKTKLPETLAE